MPVHGRQKPPSGHGEVLCIPPREEWTALLEANLDHATRLPGHLSELRNVARAESAALAREASAELGIDVTQGSGSGSGAPIVMTGHQPAIIHPGVWIKYFLLDQFVRTAGAIGVDAVVDTDAAAHMTARLPRRDPDLGTVDVTLHQGDSDVAYAHLPVPDAAARQALRAAGSAALGTLDAAGPARCLASYCDALDEAAGRTDDLGSALTAARRSYEARAAMAYLELPLSRQALTPSFRRFAGRLLADAGRFRAVHNAELAAYRQRTGTRSSAQPFPDLAERDGVVETPFWLLDGTGRATAGIDARGVLHARGAAVADLGGDAERIADTLAREELLLAPKALALTMFERLFVADLFIHGTGGGRYDRVTDAVMSSYWGVEPPAFVIGSMTLLLPLGIAVPAEADLTAAERQLARFEHNPDELLAAVEFDSVEERLRAEDLAARKRELVGALGGVGVDRKTLGAEVRAVNAELSRLLAPAGEEIRVEVERLREARRAAVVLSDRTYPYFLWDPHDVMNAVR